MQLSSEVSIQVDAESSITLTELSPVWIDDSSRKLVLARLHPALMPIAVWRGDNYDAAGDWTQAQAEAAVATYLGSDQQAALQALVYAG